jgi:hypothetical protein
MYIIELIELLPIAKVDGFIIKPLDIDDLVKRKVRSDDGDMIKP